LINLSDRDVFQFCGTVIAGALIFLTFVTFSATAGEERAKTLASVAFGMSIIVIFSLAARFVTQGKIAHAINTINFGLGWLIALGGVVVGIYILDYLYPGFIT
jgi:hypothetical protein